VHLSEIATATPDKPAVVTADGGRMLTYGELDRRSRRVSRLLASLGVQTGDHVALLLTNEPEYFEVAWGAQRRGTYWTPVNWHLTADEARYIVRDCGARVLFASAETADVAAQVAADQPGLAVFVTGGAQRAGPASRAGGAGGSSPLVNYETAISAQSAEPIDDEVDGAVSFYSSGTTGRPKGIKPKHAFPPFGSPTTLPMVMSAVFGFDADSIYLCPAPLYHAAPNNFSLGTHRLGGTVVLMDRFDPAGCLRAIEAHRVSHVQFVPTHFVRMLRLPDAQRLAFDVSSLRTVVHAAAPCPADVKRQMIEWLGPCLVEYYAGSEANGITIIDSTDWLAHPGSVGRSLGTAVHIVGEDGAELAAGEDGLIYFESQPFEYLGDPAKTASALDDRGWSTLGDIGHVDADGYLYLSDRRTDLIISGGVNIYPAEIEEALISHPAVDDVAVIGVPDPEMGQQVLAIVQLTGQGTGSADLAAEMIEHCRARLASFKCPRSVEFVAELPRLPTGKLLRRQLRAERVGQAR
jgi:long-chain acyl-CoA synthetase